MTDVRRHTSSSGRRPWIRSTPGLIACWLLSCGLVASVSFAVGNRSDDALDESRANSETRLTVAVPVTQRSITESTSYDSSLRLGEVVPVIFTSDETSAPVVTRTPLSSGTTVQPSQVIAEVAGEPVFAFPIAFPMYRDLKPLDSGVDVLEIQNALSAAGLYSGANDGQYGSATAAAVARLYTRNGYGLPAPDETALAELEAAKDAIENLPVEAPAAAASDAQIRLRDAEVAAATPLPRSAIQPIPAGVTVISSAAVGSTLTPESPVVILRSGTPRVVFRANVAEIEGIEVGRTFTITPVGTSLEGVSGTVVEVSDFREADSSIPDSIPGHDVTLDAAEAAGWPDETAVQVSPVGEDAVEGLAVPLTALRQGQNGPYVVVVQSDETAGSSVPSDDGSAIAFADPESNPVPITIVKSDSLFAIIEGDLGTGDYVVVSETG